MAQTPQSQSVPNDIVAHPRFSEVPIGHEDPAARSELQASITAMGLGSWTGAQASGSMRLTGAETSAPATLLMLPANRERLSFAGARDEDTTVVNGLTGRVQSGADLTRWMSPTTALSGIAPFDIAQGFSTPSDSYSLIDHGVLSIDGAALHRVSIERVIPMEGIDLQKKSSHSVIDCYFDTATHLLRKTAAMVTFPGVERQRVLRIMTYADYRPAGAYTLPYSITETIEGRATWALSISSFDTTNVPTENEF